MTKTKRKKKRWKFIGFNPLSGKAQCVTDTELAWCSIEVSMHHEGEDSEVIAKAIAEFLNERFPTSGYTGGI